MFKPKITLSAAVYEKIKTAAKLIGASSVEELAERVLSAESDKIIAERSPKQAAKVSDAEVERIAQQMKGLGYLDQQIGVMATLNHLLGTIFDQLISLLNFMPSWAGLVLFSAISGVVLLLIYGRVSWQAGIARIKVQIMAALREVVLFRHDALLTVRAQGRMFVYGLAYLLIALPPVIVLAVPCIILLAQLNQYYGIRPLTPGEASIISVSVDNADDLYRLSLKAGDGLELSPPVRVPSEKEAYWRVRSTVLATAPNKVPENLMVSLEAENTKEDFPIALAPSKQVEEVYRGNMWWRNLLFGAEKGVGILSVREISVSYPDREYRFLGFNLNWIVVFFLISLLSGWVTSRVFHVEI